MSLLISLWSERQRANGWQIAYLKGFHKMNKTYFPLYLFALFVLTMQNGCVPTGVGGISKQLKPVTSDEVKTKLTVDNVDKKYIFEAQTDTIIVAGADGGNTSGKIRLDISLPSGNQWRSAILWVKAIKGKQMIRLNRGQMDRGRTRGVPGDYYRDHSDENRLLIFANKKYAANNSYAFEIALADGKSYELVKIYRRISLQKI